MRRRLDARTEDEILRKAERVDGVLVRVEALRFTEPLLRKAGYLATKAFHRYLVPVEVVGGALRVKTQNSRFKIQ